MQTHDDDGDAGNNGEFAGIGAQHGADGAGAGAERHEDRGESEHEQQRSGDRFAPDPRFLFRVGKALERSSGEIDQIGRHQGQHAGRQEAQHARQQHGGDCDIQHGALMPAVLPLGKPVSAPPARM